MSTGTLVQITGNDVLVSDEYAALRAAVEHDGDGFRPDELLSHFTFTVLISPVLRSIVVVFGSKSYLAPNSLVYSL